MRTSRGLAPLHVGLLVGVLSLVGGSVPATAGPIDPGLDQFTTGTGAFVDLSDFGLGMIGLIGIDLDPDGDLGYAAGTDTIVRRHQGLDPLNVGDEGTVDIELVGLHLCSALPVDLSPLGGSFVGVSADLHLTINKASIPGLPVDTRPASIGRMRIEQDDPDGGRFDSCLGQVGDPPDSCTTLGIPDGGVYALGTFTSVGGDPTVPSAVLTVLDAPRIAVGSLGGTWAHVDGDDDHFEIQDPIPHDGPHPIGKPTAVELIDFRVDATADGVDIVWRTGSELDTLGFNLYRSRSPNHLGRAINDRVLRRRGELDGASYQWGDQPGVGTFYYTLEALDAAGGRQLHGPVRVTADR